MISHIRKSITVGGLGGFYYIIVLSVALLLIGTKAASALEKNSVLSAKDVEILEQAAAVVQKSLQEEYVDEVSQQKVLKGMLNGIFAELDAHSAYLDIKSLNDLKTQTQGKFGGLGIEIVKDETGLIKVVSPIDDTPAYNAGIKAGDLIVQIDNKLVSEIDLEKAVQMMRGEPGTKVTLRVLRKSQKDYLTFNLARDIIKIKSVKVSQVDNVGIIRISSFNEETNKEVEAQYKALAKTMKGGTGPKGIVLDLRNNPGGILDQAILVSDSFLNSGKIVSVRYKRRDSDIYKARKGVIVDVSVPMVVLINSGSASASEIVAGALKDNRRAIIMGEKSFGKGSVQKVYDFRKDEGIKLTIAKYYTPNDVSIQATGIEPDIVVNQASVKLEGVQPEIKVTEKDLSNHLQQEAADMTHGSASTKKDSATSTSAALSNGGVDAKKDDVATEQVREKLKSDYQLSRAVELVLGLSLHDNNKVLANQALNSTAQNSETLQVKKNKK